MFILSDIYHPSMFRTEMRELLYAANDITKLKIELLFRYISYDYMVVFLLKPALGRERDICVWKSIPNKLRAGTCLDINAVKYVVFIKRRNFHIKSSCGKSSYIKTFLIKFLSGELFQSRFNLTFSLMFGYLFFLSFFVL